ncbi:MAG: cohesin domain-containing protein, partial [Patescibacteria group bacterium]
AANLSFPPDKLQVVTPSTGKSLIQVWVDQPSFSNTEGTLRFQGAIPTPGINTQSGMIATMTFRVKQTGVAALKILDTSRVLLNDGKGTDILGERTGGIFELILPPPAGPLVTSPTHPDQTKWYSGNNPALTWSKGSEVRGFSYVLNDSPIDTPDDITEGVKTNVAYKDLPDGIHYFHIKSLGVDAWGGVTHYAINIDKTPPAAFELAISPGERTSRKQPIFDFDTTDEASGIDHYELKLIPLDQNAREVLGSEGATETPFFVEVSSPYYRELDLGRFEVVVRAYDKAGNYFQTEKKLTITKAIFEFIKGEGLSLRGNLTISWIWVWIIGLIAFGLLFLVGKKVWRWHREVEHHLEAGAHNHPAVSEKFDVLKEKMKEYGKDFNNGKMPLILLALSASLIFGFSDLALAQSTPQPLSVEPPIVTLFPESISNDEILFIGGRAGAPEAEVIVYIQEEATGESISQTVKTDKDGGWFYSFPQFFDAGEYVGWTQLKVGEQLSPPSAKLELLVAPTAIQFGDGRFSYEQFYFIILLILAILFVGVFVFIGYHLFHHRKKQKILFKEIREAEDSIRRGFLVLRRDIESELAVVRKMKGDRELGMEERVREEKLLKDIETVSSFISKEVWDIEKSI